ncbi:MAG: MBL fold metallo-hydrolase [Candidatus Paceibacterota bacterium]|jgi:L-ascorbate metabolism protein UlaG (beta-lactamase superfamily)
MKIKKLGHCCLVIEENSKRIMIDPGKYTTTFQNEEKNIDYIFITHEHSDHIHVDSLKVILKNNPNVEIITNVSVGKILDKEEIKYFLIEEGQEKIIGGDILICGVGKLHKGVYEGIPRVENIGFTINDKFFYPGDALENPKKQIEIVAFPVVGSWLKLSGAIDWLKELKPKIAFPVHDGIINEYGKNAFLKNSEKILSNTNIEFKVLEENKEEFF